MPRLLTAALARALEAELKNGPIPFRRFMALALYHPGGGYYRRERASVGRTIHGQPLGKT